MSAKANWIPADIWAVAERVEMKSTGNMEFDITLAIAEGMLIERERCGQVVAAFRTSINDDLRQKLDMSIDLPGLEGEIHRGVTDMTKPIARHRSLTISGT